MRIKGEYERIVSIQGDASDMNCIAIKTRDKDGEGSDWVYLSAKQGLELIAQISSILNNYGEDKKEYPSLLDWERHNI